MEKPGTIVVEQEKFLHETIANVERRQANRGLT